MKFLNVFLCSLDFSWQHILGLLVCKYINSLWSVFLAELVRVENLKYSLVNFRNLPSTNTYLKFLALSSLSLLKEPTLWQPNGCHLCWPTTEPWRKIYQSHQLNFVLSTQIFIVFLVILTFLGYLKKLNPSMNTLNSYLI